jgi:hypothetical protein
MNEGWHGQPVRRVNAISHDALIASAEAVLNPHTVDGRLLGDVAAALVTKAGMLFSAVRAVPGVHPPDRPGQSRHRSGSQPERLSEAAGPAPTQ